MAIKAFQGELTGNGRSAKCLVQVDDDGANCVLEVEPELPEGDYELSVNGLVLRAQYAGGRWMQINY